MQDPEARDRRDGVRLDPVRFDHELARRGLTSRRLAELSGVHEVILSRGRHGGRIREATLAKIAKALSNCPPLVGVDEIIAEPVTVGR